MRYATRLMLVLLIAFGAGSCGGGSSSNGGGNGSGEDLGTAGDSVAPLPDQAPGIDTPPVWEPECLTDEDCGPKEVCDCQGLCSLAGSGAECTEDKNCGGKGYCDPCLGRCFDKKTLCDPCNSENSCDPLTGSCRPVGNQCELPDSHCMDFVSGGSYCGKACLSTAGCPQGYTCEDLSAAGIPVSQCIPIGLQCGLPGECQEDADCEFGKICNQNKMCVPGCQADTECPQGKVCSAFRCQDACHPINNPCPPDQECNDEGHCMIPGGCIDQYDCEAPETYCDPVEHMCKPGCLEDFDCKKASKECEDGVCVDRPCPGNYWCNFGEVCDLTEGICEIPPEPFCEECEADEECGPEPSKCLELQDEEGTSKGKFCFPKCYDDPENECPQGWQCVDLVDQDGASQGRVCARTCYEQPVGF